MLTFKQFLLEYPTTDLRYYKELPDLTPPKLIQELIKKYHLEELVHFKSLTNKKFHCSFDLNQGFVEIIPNETLENWTHELGHENFNKSDKQSIIPTLDLIAKTYGVTENGVKYLNCGKYSYTYSHSGKQYEHDEIFAIRFAYYEGPQHGHYKDPIVNKAWEDVLDKLQKEPIFNPSPYPKSEKVV